jgi:hypothetical protein
MSNLEPLITASEIQRLIFPITRDIPSGDVTLIHTIRFYFRSKAAIFDRSDIRDIFDVSPELSNGDVRIITF